MMNRTALKRRDRYLVVVADDLGRSSLVNRAVARAFDRGFLTAASLMAGGDAFEEAATLARVRPALSVGLHVTLCDGRAVLAPSDIPGLIDREGWFVKSPLRAGLRYWRLRRQLTCEIEAEIEAQFNRLQEAGISPTHVDGHHHLHMHPAIFELVCRAAARRQVAWVRIPRESLAVLACAGLSIGARRLAEWAAFRMLAVRNLKIASEYGLKTASYVVGLSRKGGASKLDEKYFRDLLPLLRGVTNEIYAHPDLATEAGRRETEALISVNIREAAASLGLACTGYSELLGAIDTQGLQEMRK
ncbi:MAG TPA: ChbG/HpnK family deacetylase [Syntrophorhabdales bacterium]|nr:ChbG/HpnK family deacetylase [Syntrophorhabdales bacterium]